MRSGIGGCKWHSACCATALRVQRTRVNAHHFTRTLVRAAGDESTDEPRVLHEADDWMVLNKVSRLQWLSAYAVTASTDTYMCISAACRLAQCPKEPANQSSAPGSS